MPFLAIQVNVGVSVGHRVGRSRQAVEVYYVRMRILLLVAAAVHGALESLLLT